MLTKSLAMEWSKYGIKVNTIAPGYMKTALTEPMFNTGEEMIDYWMSAAPMGRPGEPEKIRRHCRLSCFGCILICTG